VDRRKKIAPAEIHRGRRLQDEDVATFVHPWIADGLKRLNGGVCDCAHRKIKTVSVVKSFGSDSGWNSRAVWLSRKVCIWRSWIESSPMSSTWAERQARRRRKTWSYWTVSRNRELSIEFLSRTCMWAGLMRLIIGDQFVKWEWKQFGFLCFAQIRLVMWLLPSGGHSLYSQIAMTLCGVWINDCNLMKFHLCWCGDGISSQSCGEEDWLRVVWGDDEIDWREMSQPLN
jgi:hypothetical protein